MTLRFQKRISTISVAERKVIIFKLLTDLHVVTFLPIHLTRNMLCYVVIRR